MKTKFLLFSILLTFKSFGQSSQIEFPEYLMTEKTVNHIKIYGTKFYAIIPKEYKLNKTFKRYYDGKSYISFIESSLSYNQSRSSFTKENLESEIGKIDIIKTLKVNNYDAVYYEFNDKNGKKNLLLVFGDDSFLAMIEGRCNSTDDATYKTIHKIFTSFYYDTELGNDALEKAKFTLDLSFTNFEYLFSLNNFYTFSKKEKKADQDSTENAFVIGEISKVSKEYATEYVDDLLKKVKNTGITILSKTNNKAVINNYEVYSIQSNFMLKNKNGVLYIALLLGENSSIIFEGYAYDNLNDNLANFKKTVESIRIK